MSDEVLDEFEPDVMPEAPPAHFGGASKSFSFGGEPAWTSEQLQKEFADAQCKLAEELHGIVQLECESFRSNLRLALLAHTSHTYGNRYDLRKPSKPVEGQDGEDVPRVISAFTATPSRGSASTNGEDNSRTDSKGLAKPLKSQNTFYMSMEHGSFVRRTAYRHFADYIDWWLALEEPRRTGALASFTRSKGFEMVCALVILLNGVFAVYATNLEVTLIGQELPLYLSAFEVGFLAFYCLELGFKLAVHRLYFFANEAMRWNIFDFVLVVFTVVDIFVSMLGESEGQVDVTFMRSLRLLKLAKILRMVRVMRFFSELRVILNSVLGSFVSLFWSLMMLVLIFYIFGLLFVQGAIGYLASPQPDPLVETDMLDHFGSVQVAMLTLFRATTGGDDWAMHYVTIAYTGTMNIALFLFFIAFMQIALMNILTGIFVESALKLAQPDRDVQALDLRKQEKEFEDELRHLCSQLDKSCSGYINKDEFHTALEQGKLKSYLAVLGLEIKDAEFFFGMLAEQSQQHSVNIESFVQGCMRLKGQATSLDVQLLVYAMNMVQENIAVLRSSMNKMEDFTISSMMKIERGMVNPSGGKVSYLSGPAALSRGPTGDPWPGDNTASTAELCDKTVSKEDFRRRV